jgi:hypothetical protein
MDWISDMERMGSLLNEVVQNENTYKLWPMNLGKQSLEEEMGNCILQANISMMTTMIALSSGVAGRAQVSSLRPILLRLFAMSVKKYGFWTRASQALMSWLTNDEHSATFIADLLAFSVEKYSLTALVGEMLREIGHMNPSLLSKDSVTVRSICTFMIELTNLCPNWFCRIYQF